MAGTRVTVYRNKIARAFLPGGTPYQNMARVAKTNLDFAQQFAPSRTGRLRKSLEFDVEPDKVYGMKYHVQTPLDYAKYTLRDTVGPIYGNHGMLWIRPQPYSYFPYKKQYARKGGRTPMFWVHGYQSEDWLKKSIFATFKKHRLI